MLNIEIQSVLFNQVVKENDSYYTVKYASISVDARVIVDANGKMKVYGKGSKKCNTYIKDCVIRYESELKELNNKKEAISWILQDIETKSNNRVKFEKVSVYREDSKLKCYAWVFKTIDGYTKRIGTITIDANTYEIESYKGNKEAEDMEKFVTAYKKYIGSDEANEGENEVKLEPRYKNNIIEVVEDAYTKSKLYKALEEGSKIGYTTNLRGIPKATYDSDEKRLYIIINPDRNQEAYVDRYITPIKEAIESHYNGYEDALRELYLSNIDDFREVIKEDAETTPPLTQYNYIDIIECLQEFYKLGHEQKTA
jgi:hypothetical protein